MDWIHHALDALERAAGSHPILVGILLVIVALSTILHALSLGGHLLLALSEYLLQQLFDIRALGKRLREHGRLWRDVTIDIWRFRTMTPGEIDSNLRQHNIDPEPTTQIVEAFTKAWLSRQVAQRQRSMPPASGSDQQSCDGEN